MTDSCWRVFPPSGGSGGPASASSGRSPVERHQSHDESRSEHERTPIRSSQQWDCFEFTHTRTLKEQQHNHVIDSQHAGCDHKHHLNNYWLNQLIGSHPHQITKHFCTLLRLTLFQIKDGGEKVCVCGGGGPDTHNVLLCLEAWDHEEEYQPSVTHFQNLAG